jgi:hypothetical protein
MAVQVLKFTSAFKEKEYIWINPEQVIYAETGEKKDSKDSKVPVKYTVVHVTGKDGKVFIKESPEEMNRIFRSVKKEMKIEY